MATPLSPQPPLPPTGRPLTPPPAPVPPRRPGVPGAVETPVAAAPQAAGSGTGGDVRRLIVGREISLSGEISRCDFLIVEGSVDAKARECHKLEIAEIGLFKGTADLEEADIAGRFEGEITVRGRLRIRSTGRVSGKIVYGELEVEAGGKLEGEMQWVDTPRRATSGGSPASASPAPSFGGGSSEPAIAPFGGSGTTDLGKSEDRPNLIESD